MLFHMFQRLFFINLVSTSHHQSLCTIYIIVVYCILYVSYISFNFALVLCSSILFFCWGFLCQQIYVFFCYGFSDPCHCLICYGVLNSWGKGAFLFVLIGGILWTRLEVKEI
ncbi:hypothetical protein E2542_SST06425 [Spatholobus suberectus]|nr:hypothetical protein E2542_SST06425 [Spatholobus suberectus]